MVVVDLSPLIIPESCTLPIHYNHLPYDCLVAWFLTSTIGVSAMPCSMFTTREIESFPRGAVRFSFGRSWDELQLAKTRLRALKAYL